MSSASEPTDLRETTAWLERKIVFEQRPLGAVADEFNRYNDKPFTIDDPALRRLTLPVSLVVRSTTGPNTAKEKS